QCIVRNLASFGNDGTGAHQAVASDMRVIQDDCLHAYQGALLYGAAMLHGLLHHGCVLTDGPRSPGVATPHAAFLDIGIATDLYGCVVAADADVGPDADTCLENDVSDDIGAFKDEGISVDDGREPVELIDGHTNPKKNRVMGIV